MKRKKLILEVSGIPRCLRGNTGQQWGNYGQLKKSIIRPQITHFLLFKTRQCITAYKNMFKLVQKRMKRTDTTDTGHNNIDYLRFCR